MRNIKKFVALGLAGAMVLSMAACGNSGSATGDYKARTLNIGSWWREYYASGDSIEDSTDWSTNQDAEGDDETALSEKAIRREIAQLKFDNVATLEETYNCKFYWQNLTYEGTKESINTSILSGKPDCDIYMVDAPIAIPAQNNGLLLDLKTVLPADHDIFTTQKVMSYVDLGDGKACIIKVNGGMANTYPLAYNVEMIQAAGLEDPAELWEKGEWTWDKFYEYCEALTDIPNGKYGYCGFAKETINELLFSNGAAIAGGATETLTSAETTEVLEFVQKLYQPNGVSYPYDYDGEPWESMRKHFPQGDVAFSPMAVWIQDDQKMYPIGGEPGVTFHTKFVRWPVGPSGDKNTNPAVNAVGGNFFVIPVNVKEPERVFNFLYDLYNWYDGDVEVRDNPVLNNWWIECTDADPVNQQANWLVQQDCYSRPGLELYDNLNLEKENQFEINKLISGEQTVAQFQEINKQVVQDALDAMFK